MHKIKELEAGKLVEFLKLYFNQPSTSLEQKSEMLYKFLKKKNVDIMFIQEGGSMNYNKFMGEYEIKQRKASSIIFKKGLFGDPLL